jgi:predicted dehydrogenase
MTLSRRRFVASTALALGGPLLLRGAPSSTTANRRFRLAVVGCGARGCSVMKNLLAAGVELVALCDADSAQIAQARADALKVGGESTRRAKAHEDYRRLLDDAASFDGVLIATPDHWHAPLAKAFMHAGRHVYCEKPLAHDLAETRELRELARRTRVVTQMGNQGSASASLRRCTEVIRAGALGPIREIRHWGAALGAKEGVPDGNDPVPAGLNWDLWVGPAPMRPFKRDLYHPLRWRDWHDFGNGDLADTCCHALNLPMRALDLGHPMRLVVNGHDGEKRSATAGVEFHFPARGQHPPLVVHWQGRSLPPDEILAPLASTFPDQPRKSGLLILGEKGSIYTTHWNTNGLIRLEGEPRMTDITRHAATGHIPVSLPRPAGHEQEWLDACRGEGRAFSDFDTGGLLTEIGLAAVVALRAGKSLDWDGANMRAHNTPDAARFVRREHRQKWLS